MIGVVHLMIGVGLAFLYLFVHSPSHVIIKLVRKCKNASLTPSTFLASDKPEAKTKCSFGAWPWPITVMVC